MIKNTKKAINPEKLSKVSGGLTLIETMLATIAALNLPSLGISFEGISPP
jgi:hypothetical protein